MRKVKFKKHIKAVWIKKEGQHLSVKKEGTGIMSDYIHEGVFHKWGAYLEEGEDSVAGITVGIIELNDGTINEVSPECIKFDDKD